MSLMASHNEGNWKEITLSFCVFVIFLHFLRYSPTHFIFLTVFFHEHCGVWPTIDIDHLLYGCSFLFYGAHSCDKFSLPKTLNECFNEKLVLLMRKKIKPFSLHSPKLSRTSLQLRFSSTTSAKTKKELRTMHATIVWIHTKAHAM